MCVAKKCADLLKVDGFVSTAVFRMQGARAARGCCCAGAAGMRWSHSAGGGGGSCSQSLLEMNPTLSWSPGVLMCELSAVVG